MLIHQSPSDITRISSNDDHISSLQDGLSRALKEPLGNGVGSTGSASLLSDSPLIIEDHYLFIAHEVGWIGLGLFLTIFIYILTKLWRLRQDYFALGVFASGVGIAIIALLLPIWTDDTLAIIWWGAAAVAIGSKHRG